MGTKAFAHSRSAGLQAKARRLAEIQGVDIDWTWWRTLTTEQRLLVLRGLERKVNV